MNAGQNPLWDEDEVVRIARDAVGSAEKSLPYRDEPEPVVHHQRCQAH